MNTDSKPLEESYFGPILPYITWVNVLLLLNAMLGLYLFEKAWYKTRRFRNPIEELNAQFPELMRHDAPNWKKWKFYPGAITLLVPRIIFMILSCLILAIGLKLLLIGHDMEKPLTGCRQLLTKGFTKLMGNLMCLFGFFIYCSHGYMTPEQVNHYEEYLGSDKT